MSDPSQYQPVDVPPPQNPPTQVPYIQAPPAQAGLSDSAACGLAYFTFVPGLVFLLAAPYNQNREIRFHSWQSIIVFFTAIIINVFVGVALGDCRIFSPTFPAQSDLLRDRMRLVHPLAALRGQWLQREAICDSRDRRFCSQAGERVIRRQAKGPLPNKFQAGPR